MKIGIVGAENSHAAAIARLVNIEKRFRGATVDYLWGETPEFAAATAEAGAIPNIVARPNDMLGRIDAVIVDHRHPRHHLPAALPFVREGLPCFVDKPFCYRAAEGKAFLKAARKAGAPVTSFSVVPHQASYLGFLSRLKSMEGVVAGATYGPCDLRSKYGGIFFYGIHQVDAALKAFGYDVARVLLTRNGNGATGQLLSADGRIVTMNLIKEGCSRFSISAAGRDGTLHRDLVFDKNTYLRGVRVFMKMFASGREPETDEAMLRPVQVLEALEESLKSGSVERVRR